MIVACTLTTAGYVHVGTCRVSPDHNFLAYTLDFTGNEQFVLQIKDLKDGSMVPKSEFNGVVSLAWAQDGRTLFYTTSDQNQRPYRQILSLIFCVCPVDQNIISPISCLIGFSAQNWDLM